MTLSTHDGGDVGGRVGTVVGVGLFDGVAVGTFRLELGDGGTVADPPGRGEDAAGLADALAVGEGDGAVATPQPKTVRSATRPTTGS